MQYTLKGDRGSHLPCRTAPGAAGCSAASASPARRSSDSCTSLSEGRRPRIDDEPPSGSDMLLLRLRASLLDAAMCFAQNDEGVRMLMTYCDERVQ